MRGRGEGSIRQRRRADGSVYWEARVRINGPQVSFYADTKSGAVAKVRQARADAERGLARPTESLTVEVYLRQWLETTVQPSVRARTYRSYFGHCEQHIIPAIGRIRLLQLTPGHVQHMLAQLLQQGLSETSVRRIRSTLSAALRAAQLNHGLTRNVASLAKVPKSDRPAFTAETITPEDARRILDAFEGSRLEPLVRFAVATGVRQGELLALRWHDVDLDRRTVAIQHAVDIQNGRRVLARPKTERAQRSLRLPDMAVEALEMARTQQEDDRLLAGDDWQDLDLIFPNPTGGIRDGCAVTRNFKAQLEKHGLPVIRWHALRRVFAALLQDQGVPLERIRDLMGHSELRVTETYAYTMPETLARDMGAIDDALGRGSQHSPRPNEGTMRVRGSGDPLESPGNQHPRLDSNQRPAD